jgi:hypothetical protein
VTKNRPENGAFYIIQRDNFAQTSLLTPYQRTKAMPQNPQSALWEHGQSAGREPTRTPRRKDVPRMAS